MRLYINRKQYPINSLCPCIYLTEPSRNLSGLEKQKGEQIGRTRNDILHL